MSTTHTPGFSKRITVWFDTDRKGRQLAYYWSCGRALRLPLADAKAFVAADEANLISGHPMKPATA